MAILAETLKDGLDNTRVEDGGACAALAAGFPVQGSTSDTIYADLFQPALNCGIELWKHVRSASKFWG